MLIVITISIFLFLGVCGTFLFLVDWAFGGMDFITKQAAINQIVQIIRERHLGNGKFYDLGSARGKFAAKIGKTLPGLQVYGVDDNGFRVLCAKVRSVFFKNVNFRKENIFKTVVSSADIIYLYLPQELMPDLQTKLQKELKSGALVITTSVSFPSWQPMQIYDLKQEELKVPKLFLYKQV